ncbi:MAG TPA: C4-dicarboxylate transporter DcuC [Candidatus Aphodousia gallistercoris]|nr:C4-dicarboxylate transporter DcuC [Candidatus Aphodousia gallistercoris]
MSYTIIVSLVIVCVTVWALIKRYETRMVLIAAGLVMAIISLDPMMAFQQFDKSMTNANLIIAICSAMGFAGVISLTKCDVQLVALLLKPLRSMGIFLLPASMCVAGFCSVAIPSTAGLCAAVGPTLIPILVRAGFKPAIAAAGLVASVFPAFFNPGVSHDVFVAKLANMEVMDLIATVSTQTLIIVASLIIATTVICVIYKDYTRPDKNGTPAEQQMASNLPEKINLAYAIAPLVPIGLLLVCTLYFNFKISVATAMLVGAIYALAVTRTSPAECTTKFFDGMGQGYTKILGIIIAAGVFAAGLRAAGVIDLLVEFLQNSNEWAKIGGSIGPFIMGVMTGSGDAAAFAFNEAVTPHAETFGMQIHNLGMLAAFTGGLGRTASPLAGGVILVAGLAGVSPMDIVKRSAPVAIVGLIVTYIVF